MAGIRHHKDLTGVDLHVNKLHAATHAKGGSDPISSLMFNVKDYGAEGNGTADDTTAIQAAIDAASVAGSVLFFPAGTYAVSTGFLLTSAVHWQGSPGTRLLATESMTALVTIDYTEGGSGWGYGSWLRDLILDGGGLATDGLLLKGVVSASFDNVRVTNVTGAGLHGAWCQCCRFTDFAVSDNIEGFTTQPTNGILLDGASSSANVFVNPVIEKVSGSGIKLVAGINSVLINGTSEGNNIGIELGETVVGTYGAVGNTVIGMDLEVNAIADIVLRRTASNNDFFGLKAGFDSPPIQVLYSEGNYFYGGVTSGFVLDADSSLNSIDGTHLLGATATIADAGTLNSYHGVRNISTAQMVMSKDLRGRGSYILEAGETATINCAIVAYAVIAANGATMTVGEPTNVSDATDLDITIRNLSAGALTTTWDSRFVFSGWTDPATGKNRSIRFRYDTAWGAWVAVSMSQVDSDNAYGS